MTKRKLAAMAASLFLMGSQTVRAEGFLGLGRIAVDGSLEVLGQQANNETDFAGGLNDYRGATLTRTRLGLSFPDLTKNVSGRVELLRNSNSSPTGFGIEYGSGQDNLRNEQSIFLIQNAYVDFKNFFYTDQIRLGRQYVGRRGDLLLYMGPTEDDALSATAFDAVQVWKKVGPVDALFVTGKLLEDDPPPGFDNATDALDPGPGDQNITYGTLSADRLFPWSLHMPLEVGYYQHESANTGPSSLDNIVLGIYDFRAKLGLLNDSLWLGGEFAQNKGQGVAGAGKGIKYTGWAYVVNASYDDKRSNFGLKGLYAVASGDDQTNPSTTKIESFRDSISFNPSLGRRTLSDFRYGEILTNSMNNGADALTAPVPHLGPNANGVGGHAGLSGGTGSHGLSVMGAGGHFVPNAMGGKVTLSADYFNVKVTEVVAGADKAVGTEIDVAADYRYSPDVTARAGYAVFNPGTGFASNFVANPANVVKDQVTKFFAKLMIKWGTRPELPSAGFPAK